LESLARELGDGGLLLQCDVTDSFALTPLVQIIAHPAQNPRDDTFVLAGLRAVCVF